MELVFLHKSYRKAVRKGVINTCKNSRELELILYLGMFALFPIHNIVLKSSP